jgi:hypothetical protein
MPSTLSASGAGRIADHGRRLLRKGLITHREHALLEVLLWNCRGHGGSVARASYSRLEFLAHVCRETVARGLRRLEELGFIRKELTYLRVAWMLGTARRQGVSLYHFNEPATEFGDQTVGKAPKNLSAMTPSNEVLEARRQLEEIARRRVGGL